MKIKYRNENIRKQVKENLLMFRFTIVFTIISVLLILSSPVVTYIQRKNQYPIPFEKLKSNHFGSFSIYYAELTEMPEKLTNGYYGAKIGDERLILKVGDNYVNNKIGRELEENGSSTIHGTLALVSKEETSICREIVSYYGKYSYRREGDPTNYGYRYLECMDGSLLSEAYKAHLVGFIFGITGLFLSVLMIHWSGMLYVFKHFHPACGSVKYTPKEIDEQANMDDAVWLPGMKVYLAPKIMIGMSKGVTAVEYGDVARIKVVKSMHLKNTKSSYGRMDRDSRQYMEGYKEYYTYQLVVKTKRGKRLVFSDSGYEPVETYKKIYERCRQDNPDVVIVGIDED